MKRFSMRALTLLASLSLAFFAACSGDGDGSGINPVGTQVRIALAPIFDGPDQVPPALDPIALRARVTDLTQAIEYYDESFPVEAGTIFEDALDFEVPGGTAQVLLFLELGAADGVVVWSAGPDTIVVPEEGEIGTVTPVFQWVGPGAGATRLVLSPAEVSLDAGADTTLVVTAFDGAGNEIAGTTSAVDWVSESTELGDFVGQSGLWQSNGTRGQVRVIATLSPQQLSDTSVITVQPAPSDLLVISGSDQSAPAGSTLESPVEVQVIATDEEPLAGRTVLFQAQNGGSVGQTSVVTDEEGLARTSWTLGTEVGIQSLRVELEGRPEIFREITAEANPVEFQAPTSVTSTSESGGAPPGGIEVAWVNADPNVERFRVERSVDGGLSWSTVSGNVPGVDRSLVDSGPNDSWPRDQEVLHRVQGCEIEGFGCSGWTVSAASAYTLPNAPQALDVSIIEILPAGPALFVQWIDTNVHETGYDVCDSDGPGGSCTVQTLPPNAENVRIDSSLQLDSILVTVTARNPAGEAEASAWVQVVSLADFTISVVSGDGQTGIVDGGLDAPVVVEVRDGFGALAEGIDVTFTAQDGGSATPAAGITDASGQASTTWTLGSSPGTQSLIAELTEASSVFVELTADAEAATISVPTGVAASPIDEEGFAGFAVVWESADPNVERFRVERRLNGDESWTAVADDLAAEDRTFSDRDSFENDREVTYRVQGCDAAASNCSGFGVSADPVYTLPNAPGGLAAEPTGVTDPPGSVTLTASWTDTNTFEQVYTICGRANPGDACSPAVVSPDTESFSFVTQVRDSLYVTVTAENETGSAASSIWMPVDRLEDFSIALVSGDQQVGTVDSDLQDPVVVEVRNAFGDLVAGLNVSFAAQNGGAATPGSAATDAQGQASTTWTLGPAEGTQTLTAALVDAPAVSVDAEASASVAAISAPTFVSASPSDFEGEFDGFDVGWQSSDPNAERFRVERQFNGEATWTTVADNLPSGARDFFDGGSFPTDREVTYRVQACNAAATNCSGFGLADEPVYTLPTLPAGLVVQITGTTSGGVSVLVDWTDTNSFETSYEVCERTDVNAGCFPQVLPPNSESAAFTGTLPDSAFVTVKAVNETGEAVASALLFYAPLAPSGVLATPLVEEGLTGFEVDWSGDDIVTEFYEVDRSLNNGETWQPGDEDGSFPGNYLDLGPDVWEEDREVIYRVRGCNHNACSDWSVESNVVYTLPRAPTGLSGDWVEITEDGPVLDVAWTDNNNFEDGYEICDTDGFFACDPIILPPDSSAKEFVSVISPFADSVLVEVRAFNPTGFSDPTEIWISLPGASSDAVSLLLATTGVYASPYNYLGMAFENKEESDIHVGNFFEGPTVVCASDAEVFCVNIMGISFVEPVWGLVVQHSQDDSSGIQGDLELALWDGSFVTVQLSGDGNPSSIESTDLSSFGTIVGLTWTPAGSSEMGFARFDFVARTGAFPDPPTFTPPTPLSQTPAVRTRTGGR